ncbi:hypothetical protein HU200_060544 [Digitaria exilis]|uniref:R13L1/DRL21-like LRR repeat region domain-containing protein n=1 Tax=Digitaria exilis TaxID=1010633 RepID=A0A835ABV7_9POAL|nr:hypothetical protein HU200_060544 [Digitaria exilis]
MSNCHKIHILPISLCSLLHLEDLNLSCCYELQELPEEFGNIHGLRILDLSCSQLFALPETLTNLTNLEHLNLACCISLEMMPGYYGCLKKLKVLNISYCFKVRIPDGISNLCDLKSLLAVGLYDLSGSNMDDVNCVSSSIHMPKIDFEEANLDSDFDEMLKHKKLHLVGIDNVQNIYKFEKFALHTHQRLNTLRLSTNYWYRDEGANIVPGNVVLEKLIPPRTLEHFELSGYDDSIFPEWMLKLTTILPNLVHLVLTFVKCDHLPPLGQIPKLQSLVIESLPNVKGVGEVFAGGSKPFLKLRYLNISDMPNLERWLTKISTSDEVESMYVFPNLHHLKVSQCPKLRFEPSLPECFLLEIDASDEILLGQPKTPSQSHPMPTRRIKIDSCELSSSGGYQLRLLTSFHSLKFLSITTCDGLGSWGENIGALTSLEVLELSFCDIPRFLGRIRSLRRLSIHMCHIPCDFPQHLLQLSLLRELWMVRCEADFSLPSETTRANLAHIPDINLYFVSLLSISVVSFCFI